MNAQPKKKKHWLRWILIAVSVAILMTGGVIGYVAYRVAHDLATANWNSDDTDDVPACGSRATQVALGSPRLDVNAPVSHFTADGNDVYISARHFEHGGFFDPKVGRAGIWIGDAATPPSYNPQTDQVANTMFNIDVQEGKHKRVQLAAGQYWLLASNGVDIVIASCGQISGEQPDGQAAPTIPNVYHGGACDDQVYYTKHTQQCAVE